MYEAKNAGRNRVVFACEIPEGTQGPLRDDESLTG
jgi:hypothetical protein